MWLGYIVPKHYLHVYIPNGVYCTGNFKAGKSSLPLAVDKNGTDCERLRLPEIASMYSENRRNRKYIYCIRHIANVFKYFHALERCFTRQKINKTNGRSEVGATDISIDISTSIRLRA